MNLLYFVTLVVILVSEVKCNPVIISNGFFGPQNINRHQNFEASFHSGEFDYIFIPVSQHQFQHFDKNHQVFFTQSFGNFGFNDQNNRGSGHENGNIITREIVPVFQPQHQHNRVQNQQQQQENRLEQENRLKQQQQHQLEQQQQHRVQQQLQEQRQHLQQQQLQQQQQHRLQQQLQEQRQHLQQHPLQKQFQEQRQHQQQLQQQHNLIAQSSINIHQKLPINIHNVETTDSTFNEQSRSKLLLGNIINGIRKDIFSNGDKQSRTDVRERFPRHDQNEKENSFVGNFKVQEINLLPSESQRVEKDSKFESTTEKISRSKSLLDGIINGIRKDIFSTDKVERTILRNERLVEDKNFNRQNIHELQTESSNLNRGKEVNLLHHNNLDLQPESSNVQRVTTNQIEFPKLAEKESENSRSRLLLGGIINGIQEDIFKEAKNN